MKNTVEKITDKVYRHKDLFSILAVILAGILWLHTEINGIKTELKTDLIMQAKRTDRLYEMFIDLLKERK